MPGEQSAPVHYSISRPLTLMGDLLTTPLRSRSPAPARTCRDPIDCGGKQAPRLRRSRRRGAAVGPSLLDGQTMGDREFDDVEDSFRRSDINLEGVRGLG